jgi:imidazolonepropionase-like amidohydrolase
MRFLTSLALLLFVLAPAERVAAQEDGPSQGVVDLYEAREERDDWLIQDATVLTVTNGTIEGGDVLVQDGDIAAVGEDVDAPGDVEVYDASGRYVMPGIVDAHVHIGISNVNEATNPVTAEVDVGDVLDPFDVALYRALAGGVTTSHVMHGSANPIGGQNETIKHRYGVTDPGELRFEGAPGTIKFALGENPTRVHGTGQDIQPSTRMGVEHVIRRALNRAERYAAQKEAFQNGERAAPPEYSERLEALADVLSGDLQVHCHSYRADEIVMLMDVLDDFGVDDVTFQHVNEGFKVAPELAEYGAGASVFADWWAYKFEVYYSTAFNAAILARNGVLTSINSDSGELDRHLYHEAAKTQKYGNLSENQALKLITINPAKQLGIADRVGSIEEGKDADLAIFSEHPLNIYTVPQRTYVDGVKRFDRTDDPSDVRLFVDPEAPVPATRAGHTAGHAGTEEHRCMHGAFRMGAFAREALQQ